MATKIALTQTTVLADAPPGIVPVGIKFSLTLSGGPTGFSDLVQSSAGVAKWEFNASGPQFAPGTYTATCSAVDAAGAPVGPVGTLTLVIPAGPVQYQAPVVGGLTAVVS